MHIAQHHRHHLRERRRIRIERVPKQDNVVLTGSQSGLTARVPSWICSIVNASSLTISSLPRSDESTPIFSSTVFVLPEAISIDAPLICWPLILISR